MKVQPHHPTPHDAEPKPAPAAAVDSDSLPALRAECDQLVTDITERIRLAGGLIQMMQIFLHEIAKIEKMPPDAAREYFYELRKELRRILTGHHPIHWQANVPIRPGRPQHLWGTPFPLPPTPEEIQRLQDAEAARHAADLALHRQKASRELYHRLHVRGIFIGQTHSGGLLARPGGWLNPAERKEIADLKPELSVLLDDVAEF